MQTILIFEHIKIVLVYKVKNKDILIYMIYKDDPCSRTSPPTDNVSTISS